MLLCAISIDAWRARIGSFCSSQSRVKGNSTQTIKSGSKYFIPTFNKITFRALNEWIEIIKCLTTIQNTISFIILPLSAIGSCLPFNSYTELVFRYIVYIGLLLSMTLIILCIITRLVISVASFFTETTNVRRSFDTTLGTIAEKSETAYEVFCRIIIVVIRVPIKIIVLPFSWFCKTRRSGYERINDEQERIGSKLLQIWIEVCCFVDRIFLQLSLVSWPVPIRSICVFDFTTSLVLLYERLEQ